MGLQCFFDCLHHSLRWTAAWFQPQDLPEVLLPMAMSTTEPSQPAWSKPIKTIQLNARKFIIPEVMWQAAAGRKEARWYPTWQTHSRWPAASMNRLSANMSPKRPTMVTAHRLQNIANSWRKGTLVAALAASELSFAPIHSQPELTSSCCSCCMLNNPSEGAKIFVLLKMAPSIALLSHSSTQPSISFCSAKLPGFPLCSTMPGKSWGLTLSPGGSEWISISISHNYSYIIFENPAIHHCTWKSGGCWRALLACALTTWPFFARSTAEMQRWTSPVCNSKDRQCVHNALQIRMIYVPLYRDMSLLTCELERGLEGGGCHGKCHADPVSATTKCQYCKRLQKWLCNAECRMKMIFLVVFSTPIGSYHSSLHAPVWSCEIHIREAMRYQGGPCGSRWEPLFYIDGCESKLCMERSAVFRTYGTKGLRNCSCSGPLGCDEI